MDSLLQQLVGSSVQRDITTCGTSQGLGTPKSLSSLKKKCKALHGQPISLFLVWPWKHKYMKERNENQENTFRLPPAWCAPICRNSMNEICVEHCAIKRDCSAFEEKSNLKLSDMPRFPNTEGMTKEEKFTSVTVYLAKVVDHLQGIQEQTQPMTTARTSGATNMNDVIAEVSTSLNETTTNH
jgi:hypothetical protein